MLFDQVEILEKQGWVDFECVVCVLGSCSYLFKGDVVLLEMVVLMFVFDFLLQCGFILFLIMVFVCCEMLVNLGYFFGDEELVYKFEGDELLFVGIVEVLINSFYVGEQFSVDELLLIFVGFSVVFCCEVGSVGCDVCGLICVYEFCKVEQYVLCCVDQEEGLKWFECLLSNVEGLLQVLELFYCVIQNCIGDMGVGKVLMYDIEIWVLSEQKYCEIYFCLYLGDWQVCCIGLCYCDEYGKLFYVYIFNNIGIVSLCILVLLFENYQQVDGIVCVFVVLCFYFGGREVLGQLVC